MSLIVIQQPGAGSGGGGVSSLQVGSQAVTINTDSVNVVFGSAFGSVPTVRVSVARPAGADLIYANVDSGSITALGFTASLSATVATSTYVLEWEAGI